MTLTLTEASLCASFQEDFLKNPGDPAPGLVYADFLDELGFHDLANAYRWMGETAKRPFHLTPHWLTANNIRRGVGYCNCWIWVSETGLNLYLPAEVIKMMPQAVLPADLMPPDDCLAFDYYEQAIHCLAGLLATSRRKP